MSDCVFCKIVAGEVPAKIVHEDEFVIAFWDINPKASVHIIVIPKVHGVGTNDIDVKVLGYLQGVLGVIAKKVNALDSYQVRMNAGMLQEVPHLHYHLLSGQIRKEVDF